MPRSTRQGTAMVKIEGPRYLVARMFKKGVSYYWMPPKKTLEQFDMLSRRLAESDGLLETAIREAEALNRQLDAKRNGDVAALPAPKPEKIRGTLPWLYEQFQASTKYTQRAPGTQKFYDENFNHVRAWSELAGHPPVKGIPRDACFRFYELLCTPGDADDEPPMMTRAKNVMTTLRRVLTHGVDIGEIPFNPASKLELVTPEPRDEIWTDSQVQQFIDAALKAGRPSMALAVRITADLGLRRGDMVRLQQSAYANGMFTLRPQKTRRRADGNTGKWIQFRALQWTRDAMAAWAPQSDGRLVHANIIVSEKTRQPYNVDTFTKDFREIADSVVPALVCGNDKLLFMDLRRTAVVNLARAGCTVPEIAAITGHSKKTIYTLLETYLPTDAVVAENAITKLEAYRKQGTNPGQS